MVNIYFPSSGLQTQSPLTTRSKTETSQSGQAQAIDTLLSKLAENIPGMSADGLKSLNAEDFSPDKVASRISDFVAAGLAAAARRGADDERLKQMYQAALDGAETGFSEARDVLDQLGALQGEVAEQVDATEKATFEALEALAPGATEALTGGNSVRMGIVERFSNAEDMELQVRTQDGDEVTIRFSRDQQYDSGMAAQSDGQGTAAAIFSLSRSESSEYSFTIDGDLDEGEIDALQNLIKDVTKLADDFFDGDVQKAFERSSELRFDGSELASMNLNMSYTRQYTSVASYEQVQQLAQPEDKPGRRLGHLMKDLAESFGAPSLGFLGAPGQFGRDLLSGLMERDTRFNTASDEQQDSYRNNLSRLLDAVFPMSETGATETGDNESQES